VTRRRIRRVRKKRRFSLVSYIPKREKETGIRTFVETGRPAPPGKERGEEVKSRRKVPRRVQK